MPGSYLYRVYCDTNELNMTHVLSLLDRFCSKNSHRLLREYFKTVVASRTDDLKEFKPTWAWSPMLSLHVRADWLSML